MKFRTQKAHGLMYLSGKDIGNVPFHLVAQTPAQAASNYLAFGFSGIFARPCPVTPRHGFVDSQSVNSADEACDVFRKAQQVDPEAEMILMQFIKAVQSAVLTPNAVSVGFGNDGVTGKGQSVVTLPLARVNFDWLDKAEARIETSPYIESVRSERGTTFLVQLRDGPVVTSMNSDAYIPRTIKVKYIIPAEGDLLEWETRMHKASPGTVVHMPGGSMLSHYAVHAVINNIPVVFTPQAPQKGDTLKRNVSAKDPDYDAIARALSHVVVPQAPSIHTGNATSECANMLTFAAVMAHQATALVQTQDGCLALGLAIGHMLKCAAAAARAEARHMGYFEDGTISKGEREVYYANMISDYIGHRHELLHTHELFENGPWSCSYGGKRWAGISGAVIMLDRAAQVFVNNPNKDTFQKTLGSLHTLLNAIHNGASWLAKFLSINVLDAAANGDIKEILDAAYIGQNPIILARTATLRKWEGAFPEVKTSFWQEDDGHYEITVRENAAGIWVDLVYGKKGKDNYAVYPEYVGKGEGEPFKMLKSIIASLREKKTSLHERSGDISKTYVVPKELIRKLPQAFMFRLQDARNSYLEKKNG